MRIATRTTVGGAGEPVPEERNGVNVSRTPLPVGIAPAFINAELRVRWFSHVTQRSRTVDDGPVDPAEAAGPVGAGVVVVDP